MTFNEKEVSIKKCYQMRDTASMCKGKEAIQALTVTDRLFSEPPTV